jgi:Domain of unknown function (DUF4167)
LINNNRQQQQGRRRGRGRSPQGGGGRNEGGSRIDSRARGNAPQMLEKYKNMARDAQLQGDRVMTEYYLQFSDHYFRIVAEQRARIEEQRGPRDDWQGDEGDGDQRPQAEGLDDEADGFGDQDYRQQQQAPRQQQRDNPRRDNRDQREPREGQSRDTQSRDNSSRDSQPRDTQMRDSQPRDNQEREPRRSNGRNGNARREEPEDVPAMLDVSVLPPAFASDGPLVPIDIDDTPAPAPRRRVARPKKDAVEKTEAPAE